MKYRSLIIKGIVFLVLFIGIDFLLGKVYRSLELKALAHSPYGMVTEYTMWKVDTDVIILGASEVSHSYIPSILEDRWGLSVYNCGKDGCRFYYQNAMVNGVLDRYNPKMIIWSISPKELCTPSAEDRGFLSQLNPFYKENEFCQQALKTKSKYEPIKLMSSSYTYNSRLFPYLYKIFMPDYSYEKGYVPLFGSQKDLEIKDIHWKGNYEENLDAVFDQTIKRCKQNNVQIVFIFTPQFENENHGDFEPYRRLKETIEKNDIPLIEDLYHDEELMRAELFKDNAHLNDDGARIFNKKLADKLKLLF